MDRFKRVPVGTQCVEERVKNFRDVYNGYTEEEAILESTRCLYCKKPRCVEKCPVNIDIPTFIKFIRENDFESASKTIYKYTSLPAICGRVCPQENQCEGSCIVGIKGEPLNIGMLERFVADWAFENYSTNKSLIDKNGKKVAIIGSGPAGLTCAGDLAKMGYDVTIFEKLDSAGGILDYGIPEFRLPKETVVKREVDAIKGLGVKIITGKTVGEDIKIEDLLGDMGFKAIFIGCGASINKSLNVKGEDGNGVFSGNDFLTRVNYLKRNDRNCQNQIYVGKKIAIIGGGNVAMDVARTAIRLGSGTHIIYRRNKEQLPAREKEIKYCEEEGIEFQLSTNPKEILLDESKNVIGLRCVKMELGDEDSSGRPRPIEVEGSDFIMDFDTVVLSLGTSGSSRIHEYFGVDVDKDNLIVVDENFKTSRDGVYAGGDAVTGPLTVIKAMEAGKKSAKAIDEYISSLD